MARIDSPRRRPVREREVRDDEFYETMAAPAHTYRSDIVANEAGAKAQRAVNMVAGILNMLLTLRFLVALFTTDTTNPVTAVIFNATNWLVIPMQSLFGTIPSGGGGYFDLPALASIALVAIIAWAINLALRSARPTEHL